MVMILKLEYYISGNYKWMIPGLIISPFNLRKQLMILLLVLMINILLLIIWPIVSVF